MLIGRSSRRENLRLGHGCRAHVDDQDPPREPHQGQQSWRMAAPTGQTHDCTRPQSSSRRFNTWRRGAVHTWPKQVLDLGAALAAQHFLQGRFGWRASTPEMRRPNGIGWKAVANRTPGTGLATRNANFRLSCAHSAARLRKNCFVHGDKTYCALALSSVNEDC